MLVVDKANLFKGPGVIAHSVIINFEPFVSRTPNEEVDCDPDPNLVIEGVPAFLTAAFAASTGVALHIQHP